MQKDHFLHLLPLFAVHVPLTVLTPPVSVWWKLLCPVPAHLFPSWPAGDLGGTEIGRGGSIYSTEISKLCKPRPSPPSNKKRTSG